MAPKTAKQRRDAVDEFISTVQKEIETQGISMSELARRAGVTRPYLHRVIGGEQSPSLEVVQKILGALGLGVSFEKIAV